MNGSTLSPVPQSDRIISIDLLRGIAVLGILIMNIQHFSMPQAAYINPTAYGDLNGLNLWVWIISHILASEKFMSIFSMLFGAGVLLFCERAESKGKNSALLHYRRMFWLLVFGLMHAYLLWSGDILVSYSLCGMLVFLFRKKRPFTLVGIAFAFFIVPILLNLYFVWSIPYWPEETMSFTIDSWMPGIESIQHHLDVYRSGWLDQMELRVSGSIFMQTGYFFMESFWQVMALMLLGMALYKWEIFSCGRSSRFYLRLALIGLASGYLLSGLGVYLNFKHQWSMEFSMFLGSEFNYVGSVGVALGYVALVMLFSKTLAGAGIKRIFSAVGRMAFSNYILMTLLCTFIFSGHGLGLYGSIERKYQILLVLVIWILIMIISPLWLRRFRFGPLERIWRALTYGRW
ncbi:MAG: DUF418 domain-containing protein, partial [Bacteroidota bacterium]|nr:DUF418 domain-containing protein [Bacteroidota bacterium]